MSKNHSISFTTESNVRYSPDFDIVNCEKAYLADIDGDGQQEIIIPRSSSSNGRAMAEIAVYDLDLNLKASDSWDGTAMDVVVPDIDGDGAAEIIAAGSIEKSAPMIRAYKYNGTYSGNLELSSQRCWQTPNGLAGAVRSIHVIEGNDGSEIAVLTVIEGHEENTGYAQLRLYDADMQLRKIARWAPVGGSVVRDGHCVAVADIDGGGHDELLTLTSFQDKGVQKAEIRVFDHCLLLKQKCEVLADEAIFATRMLTRDIDGDGENEIVVAGGMHTEAGQGTTSQLITLDRNLNLKNRATWKTFRHSWVWDLQIADIDGDGDQEIITYGGTSMIGTDQQNAKIMGEIYIWDGKNLATKDMFIWQSMPGEDTRPSRGLVFRDAGRTGFVIATSRRSTQNRAPELEVRRLSYEPAIGTMERYRDFVNACDEKCVEALKSFALQEDIVFTPLALEALAVCGDEKAIKVMGTLLHTRYEPLFLRAVQLLRNMGSKAIDELRGIGFSVPDDWAIISPFDNTDNRGFDTRYPPEVEVDLNTFYAGKDRIVRWGMIDDDLQRDVYINLGNRYFDSLERTGIGLPWNRFNTRSVAYLLTYIQCPADMEAQIRIGSADGVKIWLDDELVHSADLVRDALLDQDIIPVSLKEKNKLLAKVANHKTNGWGLYFRVTDTEGRPIPGLRYERPEVSHIHNQMLTCEQLLSLLDAQDQHLRCLAASQLASSGDRRGSEPLAALLQAGDTSVRTRAAFALTLAGDSRGVEPLAKLAPDQDYTFQIAAGYALKRIGDALSERFSIYNLRDDTGEKVVELKVADKQDGFRLSLELGGDETAHVGVSTNMRFYLGDNISASCASIHGFGVPDSRYRGMGLGGTAIRKASDVIAEMGHSCSVVTTGTKLAAHRLYCRSGYVNRRFPWGYEKQLEKNDANAKDGKIKARDYADADEAEIQRLIEQYCCNTVGLADWWSPRSDFGPWIRIAEDEGKVIGYADVNLDPFEPKANINILHIDKEYKEEPAAARVLLSHIHKYALAEGKKMLSFGDPPVRYRDILLNMGYSIEPTWVLDYGWVNMFKVMDLTRLLREIVDLLKLRLQRSPLAGWCGSIGIRGTRLKSTLAIGSDGDVAIEDDAAESADITIIADDSLITSLISGNADIWESYRQHTLTVNPIFNERIRRLIESLFPIVPHRQGGWW